MRLALPPARRPPLTRAARSDGRDAGAAPGHRSCMMTAVGVRAHRHSEVGIIFNVSVRLHSDRLARQASTNPTEQWEPAGETRACLACQRELCPASLLRAGPHLPDSC